MSSPKIEVDEEVATALALLLSSAADKGGSSSSGGVALSTLATLLGNLVDKPGEAKYRRIRTTNALIRERVLDVSGGESLLLAVGFEPTSASAEEGEGYLVLAPFADMLRPARALALVRQALATLDDGAVTAAGGGSSAQATTTTTTGSTVQRRDSGSDDAKAKAAADRRAKEAEREKIRLQLERDRKERQANARHVAATTQHGSRAQTRQFGSKPTVFKDVGVDVNNCKGGG